ncbi:MAG: ABC transporter ATP-binding protein [Nitrospirae bacterium]|nr:MAG: ABC transporter ATP-binding protein [Nitrospirota bacterium]
MRTSTGQATVDEEIVISVEKVTKRYGKQTILSNISFNVKRGEIFGILGPDGSGKSTLMHILSGILSIDRGRVSVLGIDVIRYTEKIKRDIAIMPQGLGISLCDELSVEENIDFYSDIYDVPKHKREENKNNLLKITRLMPYRNRLTRKLSGGMRQKLALCCTLIHLPKIIILDEPSTGVDPLSRRDIWIIINNIVAKMKVTCLVSTSYMEEAERFHRIMMLYRGNLLGIGKPVEFMEKIGSPSMSHVFLSLSMAFEREKKTISVRDIFKRFHGVLERRANREDEIVVDIKELVKDFGDFRAVDHVTFSIKRGEIFGFLGPNGAGKTTIIKILCGLLKPSKGSGKIAGLDITKNKEEIKRHIGYMSQRFSLYKNLTVRENIELFGGVYGVYKKVLKERMRLVLELSELKGKENHLTGDLPISMKQRLALGCALIHNPEIIFLDEPTSGVDPIGRARFWQIIYELSKDIGTTLIVTTHYMDEVQQCDRVMLINEGIVCALDTPLNLRIQMKKEVGKAFEIPTKDPFSIYEDARKMNLNVSFYGKNILIYSKHPEVELKTLENLYRLRGQAFHDVRERDAPFEDVFIHFIEKRAQYAKGSKENLHSIS